MQSVKDLNSTTKIFHSIVKVLIFTSNDVAWCFDMRASSYKKIHVWLPRVLPAQFKCQMSMNFKFFIDACFLPYLIDTSKLLKIATRSKTSHFFWNKLPNKVHKFWEGHNILQKLNCRFVLCSNGQIYGGDFAKFCGLLRIYELYQILLEILKFLKC